MDEDEDEREERKTKFDLMSIAMTYNKYKSGNNEDKRVMNSAKKTLLTMYYEGVGDIMEVLELMDAFAGARLPNEGLKDICSAVCSRISAIKKYGRSYANALRYVYHKAFIKKMRGSGGLVRLFGM